MTKAPVPLAERIQMPDTRPSLTHKRNICGFKCYIIVSFFEGASIEDRTRPAEVFIKIAKQGSVVAGLMDGLCALLSISLQYGVPWEACKKRFEHHIFGEQNDPQHKSLLDGVVQGVERLIAERRAIIGDDKGDSPSQTPMTQSTGRETSNE